MLNKKLLAVSIAALFTASANAAVDIDLTTVPTVNYAQEAIAAANLRDGFLTVAAAGNQLNTVFNAGFAVPQATTRYVRIQLANARFTTLSGIASASLSVAGPTQAPSITLLSGGADKGTSAVFQVTTDANLADAIAIANDFTLAIAGLEISQTAPATLTYTMHETLTTAVGGTGALYTKSGAIATVKATTTGVVAAATTSTASVAKDFKEFTTSGTNPGISATLATVGGVAASVGTTYLSTGTLTPASAPTALADVLDASQAVRFTGDFTFGTWFGAAAATCGAVSEALTLNATESTATTAGTVDVTTDQVHLCVNNAVTKEVINRGSYSVTLVDDAITNDLGSIVYDTTSIAIPYLTTFDSYNQRVYIINKGVNPAAYTTSFRSEDGTTAVAGTAATGTVPGNSVLSIKATDLVTLTGKTRTSATIEIEATSGNITATTQTVNLSDESTDTVALVVSQ
ncbi:hypothetical protein [Brumicola nitratireducens]|uniref:Uncharacterized protein n=1 Tax=Glaciecola nitratireducens (strain JCM 12485 / KCTC 12276 / FR1064) TaxID=1085623 RepID=G4QIP1_GLANF|nr:hypothetical protein [Glaciecola nitratireducens]AEP31196.1 hypothetical protein GNIT_3101 [Glaciecola nitratireducens FR1064]